MNQQGKARRRPGVILFILILVFAIPLSIAWIMLKNNDMPGKTTNKGTLIDPPFSVALLKIHNEKGDSFAKGRWAMLYFNPGQCKKSCQQGLLNMRQIRIATGKNMNRVERIILTDKTQDNSRLDRMIQTEYKGTRHLFITKETFDNTIQKHVKTSGALKPGTIYLVDPMGNVIMVYKPNVAPNAIFKDIQRLLKVSQIG
jgi:cytochrome oxidase Cu insertion factor (SCO1/SenC/PrrC family)